MRALRGGEAVIDAGEACRGGGGAPSHQRVPCREQRRHELLLLLLLLQQRAVAGIWAPLHPPPPTTRRFHTRLYAHSPLVFSMLLARRAIWAIFRRLPAAERRQMSFFSLPFVVVQSRFTLPLCYRVPSFSFFVYWVVCVCTLLPP